MKCLFENRTIRKYEGRKRTSIMTIISRNTKSTNDKFATFPMNELDRNQLTEQSQQSQKTRTLWKNIKDKWLIMNESCHDSANHFQINLDLY